LLVSTSLIALVVSSQKIVHRDIKPENLLITDSGTLKIGDFGAALQYEEYPEFVRETCGTPAFIAPEMLDPEIDQFDPLMSDIWSAGLTLFYFVTSSCPFAADSVPDTFEKIQAEKLVCFLY